MNKILNAPKGDYVYEFEVMTPVGNGNYLWHSSHAYVNEALAEMEKVPNAILFHNIRVAHKQLRKEVYGNED